jgi:hypothetical protein
MGSRGSKSKLEAAREPAALLKTDHGVIVRTIDHASGDSTYHHNLQSRVAASVVASPVAATSSTVPVARAGPNNAEMKDKVLYVKKAPRASR